VYMWFRHLIACRYWYTSKHQRALDNGLSANGSHILDGEGNTVYARPPGDNYKGWSGYNESAHVCRITGRVGVVARNASGMWCV